MDIQDIERDLWNRLSTKRFKHTLGVVESAVHLAHKYDVDEEDARVAAMLHDCAKELSLEEMQSLVATMDCDEVLLSSSALLHGAAGMVLAKTRYGIVKPSILEAIRVHTTGKIDMSPLDKVIFLADYIEPNRDFPGVHIIRNAAECSLNEGVLSGYDMTIAHLLEMKSYIYPLTILGRNDILKHIKRGE